MKIYRVFSKEGDFLEKFETQLDAEAYCDKVGGATTEVSFPVKADLTCKDFKYMAEFLHEIKVLFLFSFEEAGTCAISQNNYAKAISHIDLAYFEIRAAELNQVEAMRRL